MARAIFAFDFSLNKPAMTVLIDDKVDFYVFPMCMDSASEKALEDAGVHVLNRNLPRVHDISRDGNELIVNHTVRATALANMILDTILDICKNNKIMKDGAIIANEGFSFGSKGDAMLDLSGYKYILMEKFLEKGFRRFKTYPPITIKSVAGCAKKGEGKTKDRMIESFRQNAQHSHPFIDAMRNRPDDLKKKTAWVECIDDIVDSYWNLMTVLRKEYGEY